MCSSNPYPRELPKTQTTSLLAARFQRFSPRWSAFWAPHYLEPRPRRRQSGGIAPCKGATRRRHAVRRLCMAQNPHRHQWRARCRGREGLAAAPVGGGGAWPGIEAGPGCGVRGRRRGQAAVLVGGGRARAGLEIDHSERSSRVAISRAGRRRPAHTAARPTGVEGAGGTGGHGRASRRGAERSEDA